MAEYNYEILEMLIIASVYNMTPPDSFNNGLSGTSVGKIEGLVNDLLYDYFSLMCIEKFH